MSNYFTSDIHGCYNELICLLKKVSFNDKQDSLWIAGDLVSRGPDSLKVIEYLYTLNSKIGNRLKIVLGNHDLNLIAIYSGIKKSEKEDYLHELLCSPNKDKLLMWLKCQPFLQIDLDRKIIVSHAGISPQWNIETARKYASLMQTFLSNEDYIPFLKYMYNNTVYFWDKSMSQLDQLRYSFNAFTRMRYCFSNFRLDMRYKGPPSSVPPFLKPWFNVPHNISQNYSVFFGHWSSLKDYFVPSPFIALDSGCCWGEELTMFRWEDKKFFSQPFLN